MHERFVTLVGNNIVGMKPCINMVLKNSAVLWCMSYFMKSIFMSPTTIQSFIFLSSIIFVIPFSTLSLKWLTFPFGRLQITLIRNVSSLTSNHRSSTFYCIRIYTFQVFSFSSFILIFAKKGNPFNMFICW